VNFGIVFPSQCGQQHQFGNDEGTPGPAESISLVRQDLTIWSITGEAYDTIPVSAKVKFTDLGRAGGLERPSVETNANG
jgi:hypothetical protein